VTVWNAELDLRRSLAGGTPLNPNGSWSYGYTTSLTSTSITLLTTSNSLGWVGPGQFTTPFFNVNTGTSSILSHTPINIIGNTVAVLRWTSPYTGVVSVDSIFTKTATGGNGVTPRIYKGSTLVFDGGTIIIGGTTTASFSGTISVSAGDTLDFKVGDNADVFSDGFSYSLVEIKTLG
jgi:hypothetical protein